MINFLWILLAFSLVLLNAFFVAAEFGMVKLRHTRMLAIEELYGFRGRILKHVHSHLDAYLSACQLGITLASLGLGWIGEPVFAHLFEPVFALLGIVSSELTAAISFFVAFFILSFFHIVVGELMPKSLAIRQSEKVSVWTAVPLYCFYWLMYPAIWILNTCSNFLLKKSGLSDTNKNEHFYSTEEIKLLLSASHLHGELTHEEAEMLEHTLEFTDLRVTEVMRPDEEIVMLDVTQPIQQTMYTVMQYRYSRYPVYDSKKREVIGIIHVKDLFSALYNDGKIKELHSFIRPVLKVTHKLPALDVLRKFREGMPHFALIYKQATLIGFVTLDNLLHVLIGRIKDEFHRTKEDWIINADGTLSVKGECTLYSLEQALDQEIEIDNEEIETISALIFHKLEHAPKNGDCVEFIEFLAKIDEMQDGNILKLTIYPKKSKEDVS